MRSRAEGKPNGPQPMDRRGSITKVEDERAGARVGPCELCRDVGALHPLRNGQAVCASCSNAIGGRFVYEARS